MTVLGIDTSGKLSSVALIKRGKVLGERFLPLGITPSQGLLSAIDELLRAAACNLSQLDGIALAIGPGSFTSLRVGVSIVKGLAWVHQKPVAGINTLDALAQRSAGCPDLICSLLNAQQGQVYAALYRWQDKKLLKLSGDLLISPADLAARIKEGVYFLGAGLAVYQEQLQTALGELAGFADSGFYYPQGAIIAQLGSRRFKLGQAISPQTLSPYYIRRPAAEVKWEQQHSGRLG